MLSFYYKEKEFSHKSTFFLFCKKENIKNLLLEDFKSFNNMKIMHDLDIMSDELFLQVLNEYYIKKDKKIFHFVKKIGGDNFCLVRYWNFLEHRKINKKEDKIYFQLLYGEKWEMYYKERKSKYMNSYDPISVSQKYNIDISEAEEIVNKRKEQTSGSLERYIKSYGEVEGTKRYEEFCFKSTFCLERYILKYGKEIGEEKYNLALKNKKNINSLEHLQSKHGIEEGEKRYKESNKQRGYKQTLEYFIDTFGIEEGEIKYKEVNKKKNNSSIEFFISKYEDEELAQEKYKECNKKKTEHAKFSFSIKKLGEERAVQKLHASTKRFGKASKTSLKTLKPLYDILTQKGYNNIFLGFDENSEYFLYNKELQKIYYYDMCILDKKIIIEFHGEKFHPNKNKLSLEEWNNWKCLYSNMSADEKELLDMQKQKHAEDKGFLYYIIWDSEIPTLDKIIKDLKL